MDAAALMPLGRWRAAEWSMGKNKLLGREGAD